MRGNTSGASSGLSHWFYMIDALCEVERTYMFVLSLQLLTFSIEQETNAPCKRKTNFP